MIDDNKTEEAVRNYINKNGYFIKYDEDTCVDIEFAYKDGAKWAINEFLKNLWHPNTEEPEKNRICLVRVVYHPNHGIFQDEERIEQSSFHDFGWYDYYFKYIGANYDIISWLYVDDLFPKKGGEQ